MSELLSESEAVNEPVVEYYERNTPFFLRVGEGGSVGHIHRAVWADGVFTRTQALDYVYARLLERIECLESAQPRVLDLGCGVGAGVRYLAKSLPLCPKALTISPSQAATARRLNAEQGLDGSGIICADFSSSPLPQSDLMYGVESLVHAHDLEMVARNVSRSLSVGGELALCDDFLARPYGELKDGEKGIIDCLREGWRIPSLNTLEAFSDIFNKHGLELIVSEDWTPFLKLERLRDRMLSVMMSLGGDLPIQSTLWGSWKAGNALRYSLQEGLTHYRFGIWKKVR